MSPSPTFLKAKTLQMVIQKNPCMLIQVPDSFFQAARSPSGWLGRKCFSHFQSHKNHYQTPVVHKAGHVLKTGVRGVQKKNKSCRDILKLIWLRDFQDCVQQYEEKDAASGTTF